MTDASANRLSPTALLAQYESDFNAGDNAALLNAVSVCLNCGCDVPEWVAIGFNVVVMKYDSGEAMTLDEAFGLQRQKGKHQSTYRKEFLATLIWQKVAKYHSAGNPIGRTLFETVAEELTAKYDGLKLNGTDVQEAYYAFKKVTEK